MNIYEINKAHFSRDSSTHVRDRQIVKAARVDAIYSKNVTILNYPVFYILKI